MAGRAVNIRPRRVRSSGVLVDRASRARCHKRRRDDGASPAGAVASLPRVSRYTSATDADRQAMLEAIGVDSIDDLFADVPEGLRLGRPLDLPDGKPEQEVYGYLRDLAARNVSTEDEVSFLGAGMYDHYVPALVDSIISRSEFLTPYTPYQPEVSQGGLQVMFEYQTMISELTGLPVSNASVYEGPSALAAAALPGAAAQRAARASSSSRGVHPHSRETLATTAAGWGTTIEEVGLVDGVTDAAALEAAIGDDVAAVFLAQPNFLGAVEDLRGARAGRQGDGRAADRPGGPDDARRPAPARRLRRRRRRGGGPAARQPARLRRAVASASSPPRRRTCAACPAASPARRSTPTAAAASCSRCRRASSTSAARRRRRTSARPRRSTR